MTKRRRRKETAERFRRAQDPQDPTCSHVDKNTSRWYNYAQTVSEVELAMLFNSAEFMIFFPAVCLLYYLIPKKARTLFLLVCSYFFYMCWNPEYAFLILASTVITWLSGLLISRADERSRKGGGRKKLYVALSFLSNLAILFFFKYYHLAASAVTAALGVLHIQARIPAFDVLLPVGISFYTFQALSYTMDVYRREVEPERNFIRYALFVSFFPQLVAGPIERSKNLLSQIREDHRFDIRAVKSGLMLMLYGYFQKVVLAENLGMITDRVYDSWNGCTGSQLAAATVCFALQIYCDFGGYSNIAAGAAKVLGFRLMENFNTPYFSESVAEFWHRWHISLSTWFRDYLYIPLGGNRKGKIRKWFNTMVVFTVSGMWHGASWHFAVWGALNGCFQVVGEWLRPLKNRLAAVSGTDVRAPGHRLLRMIVTFLLINITWVFFRAQSFRQSVRILARIAGLRGGWWFTYGENMKAFGLDMQSLFVLTISVSVLLIADILKYRGIVVREWILEQGLWLRWLILYAALFWILIFGVYGPEFDAGQFIYFQF